MKNALPWQRLILAYQCTHIPDKISILCFVLDQFDESMKFLTVLSLCPINQAYYDTTEGAKGAVTVKTDKEVTRPLSNGSGDTLHFNIYTLVKHQCITPKLTTALVDTGNVRYDWYISDTLLHHTTPQPGPRLNIKTVLSTYGDFHVKDKTAVRTSYL